MFFHWCKSSGYRVRYVLQDENIITGGIIYCIVIKNCIGYLLAGDGRLKMIFKYSASFLLHTGEEYKEMWHSAGEVSGDCLLM